MGAFVLSRRQSNTTIHFFVIGFIAACTSLTGCNESPTVNAVSLDESIRRSGEYLKQTVREDGSFEYCVNMDPTVEVPEEYNILRHAGTIYAMCSYYEMHPDPEMLSLIKRAGRYMQQTSIHPLPKSPVADTSNLLAVWSMPEINRVEEVPEAKLGGTGLGLVALMSIERIQPGFTPMEDLRALGRFLLFLQKVEGSFYSKYVPSLGGLVDNWHSLYYPGEAALGLAMLYEKDPSPVWAEAAARVLQYLSLSRENLTEVPADHWALLATEKVLACDIFDDLAVPRELLINHAIQICDTMIRDQLVAPERPAYDGGFTPDGRTTPAATRLEGLLAALNYLPPDREIYQRVSTSVDRGMAFLLHSQVTEGQFNGAFPRAVGRLELDLPATEQFNKRASEVRIDYVQHALSAMIQQSKRNTGERSLQYLGN